MEVRFTPEEIRVLGVLMEKQMATPEYYPMTPNAIKAACNQKSNRNPQVKYSDDQVLDILQSLRKKEMLVVVTTSGSRVRKYEHRMKETFFLNRREMAVLCVLMLRGPQTAGEIRARSERLAEFSSLEEVEETLGELGMETRNPQPLVMKLPLWPGLKEPRYAHLLAGKPDTEQLARQAAAVPESSSTQQAKIEALEQRVEQLAAELASLQMQFLEFKRQFE